jgi:hypothetical protein
VIVCLNFLSCLYSVHKMNICCWKYDKYMQSCRASIHPGLLSITTRLPVVAMPQHIT